LMTLIGCRMAAVEIAFKLGVAATAGIAAAATSKANRAIALREEEKGPMNAARVTWLTSTSL